MGIKFPLRKLSTPPAPVNPLVLLGLSFGMIFLTGCPSEREINAALWETNTPLPAELCRRVPELRDRGFRRKLSGGGWEFVSFCTPCATGRTCATDMVSMTKSDLRELIGQAQEPKAEGDGYAE